MSNASPHSYAAVAARGSPTTTSNPSPPPPADTVQAGYTQAKPDDKKQRKDPPPPGYGAQGTFPVHPYPDLEVYPATTNGGDSSRNGGGPPPQNGYQHHDNGFVAMARHEPTWLRFLRALGVAVLIYLLASMLVESIYLAARWTTGRRGRDHLPGNYNVPPDVKLYHCATSDSWKKIPPGSPVSTAPDTYPFAVDTSFDLPLDADEPLVVLSRGPWLSGDVNVVTGAAQEKGMVSVNVLVRYSREEVRDEVRACLVEREDGGEGVGIFTPDHKGDWGNGRDHHVHYETTLVLPEGASPLMLKKLETDVPNASHHIILDGTQVQFEDVALRGSNGRINIKSLTAQRASIRARNSPVTGSFNVSRELTIETSNARIEAAVIMQHLAKLNNTPKVDVKTSNAVLHTNILLTSDSFPFPHLATRDAAPHYEVKTTTSNSRLDVSLTGAPADAVLHFEGLTKNGPASAQLYPTYSGAYDVKTSNSAADLHISCPGVEPESKRKGRCEGGVTVVREEIVTKNHLKGEMEWKMATVAGEKERERKKLESSVVLSASNGPAVLNV